MQFHLTGTFNDGTITEIDTTLSTVVAWERKFKRKTSDGSGLGLEDISYLLYESIRASGTTVPGSLDLFISTLADIGITVIQDPKVDPAL